MAPAGYSRFLRGEGDAPAQAALSYVEDALGAGQRVYLVRFLRGGLERRDLRMAERYAGHLEVRAMGRDGPVDPQSPDPVDVKWAEDGLALGRRALHKGDWDVVVLVGVTRAVALGLLDLDRVLELLDEQPDSMELLLTGPAISEELAGSVDEVRDFPEGART